MQIVKAGFITFQKQLISEIKEKIDFYNQEANRFARKLKDNSNIRVEDVVSTDPTRIKWDQGLMDDASKLKRIDYDPFAIRIGLYRPYFKQNLYFDKKYTQSGIN